MKTTGGKRAGNKDPVIFEIEGPFNRAKWINPIQHTFPPLTQTHRGWGAHGPSMYFIFAPP